MFNSLKKSFQSGKAGLEEFRAVRQMDLFVGAAGAGDNLAVVEFLDKFPDAIDKRDGYGVRAIELAAGNGRTSTVQLLLERGATIDIGEDNQGKLARNAGLSGHEGVVALLEPRVEEQEKLLADYRARAAREAAIQGPVHIALKLAKRAKHHIWKS